MADLLGELKEDLWQERLTKFIQRFWRHLAAIIILTVLVAALLKWNSFRLEEQKAKSGDLYHQTMEQFAEGNPEAVAEGLKALVKAASPGYRELAQFQLAAIRHKVGKPDEALKIYLELAENGSHVLFRDMATLLAGKIYMQKNDFLVAAETLEPATKKGRPWRYSALELVALCEVEIGHPEKAIEALKQITSAQDAPKTLFDRATLMRNALESTQPPAKG